MIVINYCYLELRHTKLNIFLTNKLYYFYYLYICFVKSKYENLKTVNILAILG